MHKKLSVLLLTCLLWFTCVNLYAQGIDSYTKLMLHFDGTDGDTTTTDDGDTGHSMTFVSPNRIEQDQSVFGGTSMYCNPSGYIWAADHDDWFYGTGDITIDFWLRYTTLTIGSYYSQRVNVDNRVQMHYSTGGGGPRYYVEDGGPITINATGSGWSRANNVWYHVAVVRHNDSYQWYVDGAKAGSAIAESDSSPNIAAQMWIGRNADVGNIYGYIDEYRITKGISRWVNTFPVPTEAYDNTVVGVDTDTNLLLRFEGTDGDTSTTDGSTKGHDTWTFAGNAHIEEDAYRWGTSLAMDGTGDYIEHADDDDWDVFANTTDSWTIDFWVKHTDHVGTEAYIAQDENSNNGWRVRNVGGTQMQWRLTTGGSATLTVTAPEITDTDWHHIACVKTGSIYGIYIDGEQEGYVSDTSTDTFAGTLQIGLDAGNIYPFSGYIDELRIQKSNKFGASPDAGETDSIRVPDYLYDTEAGVGGRRTWYVN